MNSNKKVINEKNRLSKTKRGKKDRLKQQKEKESKNSRILSRLFKVKYALNSILFNSNDNINGHYVLSVAYNDDNDAVAVAVITSLDDRNGQTTKKQQVQRNLIYPLNNNVIGLSKKSGLKQEVLTQNVSNGEKIKYSDLQQARRRIKIDKKIEHEISGFIYNNNNHRKKSTINLLKVRGYKKIK